MLEMFLPFIIGLVVIGGFVALGPFYLVREQSVAIIERFASAAVNTALGLSCCIQSQQPLEP